MAMDCKLCFKRFSNGKALGAHMRSHYAILPLPPKTPQRRELTTDEKSSRLPDPESSGESESGSRFKKAKGVDTMEDVALCLIMLSRDVWRKDSDDSSSKIYRCEKCDKVFKSSQGLGSHKATHFKRVKKESETEIVVDGDQLLHECAFCPRIFKSAQALGGHKKSHFPVKKFGVDPNLKKSQVLEVGDCDPFYFS